MNKITCECCGSSNVVKEGDFFVCQQCGAKYTIPEIQKQIGVVKVDRSDTTQNLYQLARRAREQGESSTAEKYYDSILIEEPNSWEANYYKTICSCMSCTIAQLGDSCLRISMCLKNVFKIIMENVEGDEKKIEAIREVNGETRAIITILNNNAWKHYKSIDSSIRYSFTGGPFHASIYSADCMSTLGDCLEEQAGLCSDFTTMAVSAWKLAITLRDPGIKFAADKKAQKKMINGYAEKVKKYEPSFSSPYEIKEKSGGCYVATCVYGSYDCPEVWTLRRFRDQYLLRKKSGRSFVKVYYAISPTIVKHFGKTKSFNRFFKRILDHFVASLDNKGYENTPYDDEPYNL